MKPTEVHVTRRVQTVPYESVEIGLRAEPSPGQTAEQLYLEVSKTVDEWVDMELLSMGLNPK